MKNRQLKLTFVENRGVSRKAEPVRFNFSVKKGQLNPSNEDQLSLVERRTGANVAELDVRYLSMWADGSVAWVSVDFPATVEAYGSCDYFLVIGKKALEVNLIQPSRTSESEKISPYFIVRDNGGELSITHQAGKTDETKFRLEPYIIDSAGVRHVIKFVAEGITCASENFCRYREFVAEIPTFVLDKLQLKLSFDIYSLSGLIEVELEVHNTAAAEHRAGLWDRGDPGSVHFCELGIDIVHPEGELISIDSSVEGEPFSVDSMSVIDVMQPSSHDWAISGEVSGSRSRVQAKGSRIAPEVTVALPNGSLAIHVPRFWQEHPSAMRIQLERTNLALFAMSAHEQHELQPGERKRRKLILHVATADESDSQKWIASRLNPPKVSGSIEMTNVHFNRAVESFSNFDKKLAALVVMPQQFFDKREAIDEYGWRNFGEIFADHESLYLREGEPLLVSHYNNQYDLVLGFGMQFLRTEDVRWYELMDDLARHVTDIDVYRTVEDRVEYNHGLFWHTNHYQDAGNATHRTFSSTNYDPDDPSGTSGGPGPEHCYTSGLAMHYLLTHDSASRDAVIGLAVWMRNYFLGSNTLLGRLHSIAKVEFPNIVKLLKNESCLNYAYPLSRATGNLIVAYLDAFLLSEEREWLDAVEVVLVNTFHPDDDVNDRRLENVEETWSHTVFLQAVLRYLAVKEALDEEDAIHEFAKQALLAYTGWTLEHGVPYLERPEKLEFVNDTWAAQDIRRYTLMVAAATYDPPRRSAYISKAEYFSTHLLKILSGSKTLHFSRIQAIIMQNLGMASLYKGSGMQAQNCSKAVVLPALKQSTIRVELGSIVKKILQGLRSFDAQSELHWLRTRR